MFKKYFFLLFILCIIFPLNVSALSGNVDVSCDKTTVSSGDLINCAVSGSGFDNPISSLHAVILLSENLMLENISIDSSWYGSGEGGIIDLYAMNNKVGEANFITFTIRVGDTNEGVNTSILLKDILVGDYKFVEHSFEDSLLTINIISNVVDNNSNVNENVVNKDTVGIDNNATIGNSESDDDDKVSNGEAVVDSSVDDNVTVKVEEDVSSNNIVEDNDIEEVIIEENNKLELLIWIIVVVILMIFLILRLLYKNKRKRD